MGGQKPCIYFFQFLIQFLDGVYLFKTTETWTSEICMKTNEQNLLKVKYKNTRTKWLMLFWCLHHQLQTYRYWGPSWTFTMEFFLQLNRQKVKVSIDFTGLLEDSLPVLWANLFKYFKNLFLKKNQTIWCLRLTVHILEI